MKTIEEQVKEFSERYSDMEYYANVATNTLNMAEGFGTFTFKQQKEWLRQALEYRSNLAKIEERERLKKFYKENGHLN